MVKKKSFETPKTNTPIYAQNQNAQAFSPIKPKNDTETKLARNQELKHQAYEIADRVRQKQYEERWYKGDKPTTAEYYSAVRRAAQVDKDKAQQSWSAFYQMQNDPNSDYYEPYLYKMTNASAAQGIYDLLGLDISGGITQSQINELKQYADYSNIGVSGTPNESKNPSQQLAYWLYNLEKDEKTTQQAEKELEWLNQDIQTLVDKGFSDEYIVEHMDMTRYPTISKMQANAAVGAVTPLNRPIGYSNDYVFGAIWAARNGGSTGRTTDDIANWHDKVGNSYVPDKDKEAARDPASDNYHPYSFGATIDFLEGTTLPESGTYDRQWLEDNKGMLRDVEQAKEYRKIKTAVENTEQAQAELKNLQDYVLDQIAKGKTSDEIYAALEKNQLEKLEEDYPMLAKMEFARREGQYISLTDTVDFALPYFKTWIDDQHKSRKNVIDDLPANSDGSYFSRIQDTAKNLADEALKKAQEQKKDKASDEPASSGKDEEAAFASEQEETPMQEENAPETPVQDETEDKTEVAIVPTPNFDMKSFMMSNAGTPVETSLWAALYDYRLGMPITNEDALAFVEKYPYLFGGEMGYLGNVRTASGNLVPKAVQTGSTDTREFYVSEHGGVRANELGGTAAELLKKADAAQSAGYFPQYSYVKLLTNLATEIENAKLKNMSFEDYINTDGTSANELLNETNEELASFEKIFKEEKRREQIDFAAMSQSMMEAYNNGTFDDIAFENEEDKEKWLHFINEAKQQVITQNDGGYYDPKNYFSEIYGNVDGFVKEALENYDQYNAMEYNQMYWPKESTEAIVSNRVKARLFEDYAVIKTAGVTTDEYYNAKGYALLTDKDARGKGYSDLNDYVSQIVSEEAEAWARIEEAYTKDLYDAVQTLEMWEESEEDTNRFNFTEDEIAGALEYEMITPEQAEMLRVYNRANEEASTGDSMSLEDWENIGGIDAIKSAMYSYISRKGTEEIQNRELGEKPYETIGLTGNRAEGKASLGYVIGKGVELGAREYGKSWLETWYAFARLDSSEQERMYRTLYSREELRNYMVETINTISDEELKLAMLEELELFDGDIYDFNYDFRTEKIREKIRNAQNKIDWLQNDIAQHATQGQANAIQTISSVTNNTLNIASDIAASATLRMIGVDPKLAKFIGTASTSGVNVSGQTINTLMDAGIEGDKARLSGIVNGAISTVIEVGLDPFTGKDGRFSGLDNDLAFSDEFVQAIAHNLEANASENFLKTVGKKIITSSTGRYVTRKAVTAAQEAVEELAQEAADTLVTNTALALDDKEHLQKMWDWDEAWEILGDSVMQGLILDAGADLISAPARSISRRRTQNQIASRIVIQEKISTAQIERIRDEVTQSMKDGTLEEKLKEAATQEKIDRKTIEKVAEREEEIKQNPAIKEQERAEKNLQEAQAAAEVSMEALDRVSAVLDSANEPFNTPGVVPTQEQVQFQAEAQREYNTAKEAHDKNLDDFLKAQEEYETAKAAADEEIKAVLHLSEDEARAEVVEEIRAEKEKAAEEEIQKAEARKEKEKETFLSDVQRALNASDSDMEQVREKAQKLMEQTAQAQQDAKDELKKNIESRLPGWKVRYDDTSGAEAGWVVRETNRREIVFNASMDADTLASAVAAHELTHVAEDSKYYEGLKDAVIRFKYGEKADANSIREAIESIKQEYARDGIVLDDAQAEREHIAELIEDMFGGNLSWVNRLVREKPNLATRIFDWVKEKVDYLKTRFKKNGKEASETLRNFRRVESAFIKALDDAAAGTLTTDAEADLNMNTEADNAEGTVRERALKRRVEAREMARLKRNLKMASDTFRQNKDWTNYRSVLQARIKLGFSEVGRINNPVNTLRTLAEEFGIQTRIGTNTEAERFAVYDSKIGTMFTDKATASDIAVSMYAIADVIKKNTDAGKYIESGSLDDFLISYMTTSDENLPDSVSAILPAFMNEVRSMGREYEVALNTARDELITYKNASSVDRLNAFMTTRSESKKKNRFKETFNIRNATIGLIDATYAAEVVAQITGSHELRQAATYLPYARRLANRIATGEEFVTLDNERVGGDTMATALKDISLEENQEFQTYLVAKEAIDRYEMNQGPFPEANDLPSLSEMKRIVSEVEEDASKKHYVDSANKLYAFWKHFMEEYVVKEGFLSQKEWDNFKRTHPHYVPFMREGSKSYKLEQAKGNSIKPIYEPIENMVAMIEQFVNQATQNRFGQTFDRMYEQNDGLSAIAVRLPYEAETFPGSVTILDRDISTDDALKNPTEADQAPSGYITTKDGDILTVIRKDGTKVAYKVYDRALFDLLSGKSASSQKAAFNALGKLTRTMAYLTTGVNPSFIIKNFVRDFQKSVNHGTWAKTYFDGFVEWMKNFHEVWKGESEEIRDFIALGGGENERLNVYTKGGERRYKKAIFGRNENIVSKAFGIFGKLATAVETTSRFSEYKGGWEVVPITGEKRRYDKTTQEGKIRAFMNAMEVTVDFERRGNSALARTLANVIPFFNATVQGNYQQVRMFTDAEKEHLQSRMAKYIFNNVLTGAMSALSVLFFASDEDKEKYKTVLDSYKRGYIILPLFNGAERDFIRLPVSQDSFSKLCFEFGRQIGSGEIKDLDGFGTDMLHTAIEAVFEGVTDLTPIFSVVPQILRNQTWAGGNIVSDYAMELPSYLRANDDTSGFFRALSAGADALRRAANRALRFEAFNGNNGVYATLTTPAALEYAAEQLTGWVGQLVVPMISKNKYSGKWTLGSAMYNTFNSMRNAFTIDADSYSVIDEVYENAVSTANEIVTAGKRGVGYKLNPSNTAEENTMAYEEAKAAIAKGGVIGDAKEKISEIWDEINAIQTNETLSARDRRLRTEELREEIQRTKDEVRGWWLDYENRYLARTFVEELFSGTQEMNPLTDVQKLDPEWQEAYERGEEYMLRAEETGKYPKGNASFDKTTDNIKNTYVISDYPEELQAAYNDTYNETWKALYDDRIYDVDWDSMTLQQKKDFMSDIHSDAHTEAKKAFLDLYEEMGRPEPTQ